MAFLGKEYKLQSQEKFEEFLNALGAEVPAEYKKALLAHKPSNKLVQNGDSYTLTSTKPDGSVSDLVFKSGVPFDETAYGQAARTTITVDGNVVTQVQKFAKSGATLTVKREFNGDQLQATITASVWDGAARRYYKA